MCYTNRLLKGIPNETFVDTEWGIPKAELFSFHERDLNEDKGYIEESINWDVDDGLDAINQLLQRRNSNDFDFRYGYAVALKSEIDNLHRKFRNSLFYDRDGFLDKPLDDNPYHGNLLINPGMIKIRKRMISANIAGVFTAIMRD